MRTRTFVVSISIMDEYTDSDSIDASDWYGPYTLQEAENLVDFQIDAGSRCLIQFIDENQTYVIVEATCPA